ncbi:hypothetical protein K1T71_001654 [Dendrolimus kikuchii]|uniref:Uncharacterized protein n=1 Tax=Dendrolimus kikuchii TaxID=765133 RepID=A0ACC1DEN8_9NEOP|nr:hypothetical protein K1T71_001654 [Dendrolimus kikuchii]
MANYGNILIEDAMAEMVEDGATLAWRLLATLEGGSILLTASALLAYTARSKIASKIPKRRPINNVLVTNTSNVLGKEIKRQLETRGCVVNTTRENVNESSKVDALVVVGAEPKAEGLEGITALVTEDVHDNLKLLQTLSPLVKHNGCIAWACAGTEAGISTDSFANATAAFDGVLQTSLQQVAKICHCHPIWVGRCDAPERTAERVVAALLTCTSDEKSSHYFIRNAAHKVGEYLFRWLKIVT